MQYFTISLFWIVSFSYKFCTGTCTSMCSYQYRYQYTFHLTKNEIQLHVFIKVCQALNCKVSPPISDMLTASRKRCIIATNLIRFVRSWWFQPYIIQIYQMVPTVYHTDISDVYKLLNNMEIPWLLTGIYKMRGCPRHCHWWVGLLIVDYL